MCESARRSGPRGIIQPNAFCSGFLPLAETRSVRRIALSPQNVKNIVTSSSIAAAPLAMTNAAITLSNSPLNTMIVFLDIFAVLLRRRIRRASGQAAVARTGPRFVSDCENSRM